ncbi:GIY-YIG nuclease family protein [Flavobacterium amniphilum]|uniref:GIY-YIG nuclease family protein n=1 Tax=Flavobacterium amniphilum TaxID=1834035 RepID=UPI00374CCA91
MKSFPFDWRAFLFLCRFMFCVYIIYSLSKDVYYKGFTSDLETRLAKHNAGVSNYTSSVCDWELVFSMSFESKAEALKEEKRLKRLNRASIERLVQKKDNRDGLVVSLLTTR